MRTRLTKIALAIFGLAMIFTISCPYPHPCTYENGGCDHHRYSSSDKLSSSSLFVEPSSSSFVESGSSSSYVALNPCTAKDNNDTHYCSNGTMKQYGLVTYGNQTYKTIEIGTQTWFQSNLNYKVEGSKCYNNNDTNCVTYGRLYDWKTAMTACPSGWHLPRKAEWDILIATVGGSTTAGRYLKATSKWKDCGSGSSYQYQCEDRYGFAALPGGAGYNTGLSVSIENTGVWWSAESNANKENYLSMSYAKESTSIDNFDDGRFLTSVRCLKN